MTTRKGAWLAGVFTAIALVLAILKIAGAVSISWLWVAAPLWGPVVLGVAASALALLWVLGEMLFARK